MASISSIPLEHQIDNWIGNKAVEFINSHPHDKPFFLWVGFAGPHDPYNPPREIADQSKDLVVPESIPATDESNAFRDSFIKSHLEGSAQTDFSAVHGSQIILPVGASPAGTPSQTPSAGE